MAEIELVDPARLGLLETVGLVDVAMRQATVLSGGERQRVSLARALALQPSALILDEFTSGLDLSTTLAVEEVVRRVAKEGAVVVLATHDLAQAAGWLTVACCWLLAALFMRTVRRRP